MREACARAGHREPFPFYTLRHSCAARWLAAGAEMVYVAASLGNSVAICEKYYGHLSQGHMAQVMRGMPGLKLPSSGARHQKAQMPLLKMPVASGIGRSKQRPLVN